MKLQLSSTAPRSMDWTSCYFSVCALVSFLTYVLFHSCNWLRWTGVCPHSTTNMTKGSACFPYLCIHISSCHEGLISPLLMKASDLDKSSRTATNSQSQKVVKFHVTYIVFIIMIEIKNKSMYEQ